MGIGVTPSAWSGFSGVAQVHNSALASVNNGTYLYANAYYDGSNNRHVLCVASRYYQLGGNHVWETAASATAGSVVSFSEAMRIDSSGNVGIGTSSPNSYGGYRALTINGTSGGLLDFETNGTFVGEVYADGTDGLGLNQLVPGTLNLLLTAANACALTAVAVCLWEDRKRYR